MKKNIVLIGMMGCGKTTIGEELSRELPNYKYVDIDEEIEKSTQKKISEIFLKHGEPFFRMLETGKIKLFCNGEKAIISAGGGAFESEENRNILLKTSNVIYLKATPQDIYNRIKSEVIQNSENHNTAIGRKRPLLKKNFSIEKITTIMQMREKNYSKADITIDTTGKEIYDVVNEILGALNGWFVYKN